MVVPALTIAVLAGGAASRLGVRDSDIGCPAMRRPDLFLVFTFCAIPRCSTWGSA